MFMAVSSPLVFSQEAWTPTSTGTNVPTSRAGHTAVWTGVVTNKMIVWGGYNISTPTNSGGVYDPVADSWTLTSTGANCPNARYFQSAVWTGIKMIIWGGYSPGPSTVYNTGGAYDPVTNTWTVTSTSSAPSSRTFHTAIWTGTKMIVWGGSNATGTPTNTGGVYDPLTDTWTAISLTNAPVARERHTAIWTGSKMIVWGGNNGGTYYNNGGIYDPVTNTWAPTSNVNAPSTRTVHSAVWTGSKMIIWGGTNGTNTNTGGVYDASTDTWVGTSTTGAPSARSIHTAVWSGSRMIVWGGENAGYFNTGGIYDPVADAWVVTTAVGAPTIRSYQTAIITNSSMIVWGGYAGGATFYFTGGVYTNPPVIGVTQTGVEVPQSYLLKQNYPNPFNPVTNINFSIPNAGLVKLVIYDMMGREITTLVNENLSAGSYKADFDASSISSGTYFYTITSGDFTDTKKMVLIK